MGQVIDSEKSPELPPGVEIVVPTLDDIEPELRKEFAARLVEGTYSRLGPELEEGNKSEHTENVRMCVRDLLGSVSKRFESQADRIGKLQKKVYPTYTREDHIRGNTKGIEHLINEGKLLAIKKDGQVASIIGMRQGGKWPDERDFYEISKASTLPEYSGQGFYTILVNEAERRIREEHPDAPIKRGTKNPIVKKRLRAAGWTEVPFDYGLDNPNVDKESLEFRIAEAERKEIEEFDPLELKKWIRDKFSVFYFDPKQT